MLGCMMVERSHAAHDVRPGKDRVAYTRGLNPLGAMAYVREKGGAEAMRRVLARLPEEDLIPLSSERLSSTTWVPFRSQARLLEAIDKTFGTGDGSTLFEVGFFMSQRDIPRVFRPLLRLGNPGWILEVSTKLWRVYHDRGSWQVLRTPVTVLATLQDHDESHEAFCGTLVGWLTGACEISGGKDVMVDHPVCHARGAPNCVFTTRWSVASDSTPPN